jgi:hypothetical protein
MEWVIGEGGHSLTAEPRLKHACTTGDCIAHDFIVVT